MLSPIVFVVGGRTFVWAVVQAGVCTNRTLVMPPEGLTWEGVLLGNGLDDAGSLPIQPHRIWTSRTWSVAWVMIPFRMSNLVGLL
jgi:hypothetical protein